MRLKLEPATTTDATALAVLHTAVGADLTARHGKGPWSSIVTERGVRFNQRNGAVYVARRNGAIVATLTLATKKPWAIDPSYFTPIARPLYLIWMAVVPEYQRQGVGRECLALARKIVRDWPAQGIFLDAYDADAGAGEFYRKCGFREVGRSTYRGAPLIYFEDLV